MDPEEGTNLEKMIKRHMHVQPAMEFTDQAALLQAAALRTFTGRRSTGVATRSARDHEDRSPVVSARGAPARPGWGAGDGPSRR